MDKIYWDAETYYDRQYSLTKMTTTEYVFDPRFQLLGVAYAINDGPVHYVKELPDLDYENSEFIAHNAAFDAMILYRFGRKAAKYNCTLSKARYALPMLKSHSLKSVSKALNIGEKGDALVEGSYDADLEAYAKQDVELCRKIDQIIQIPTSEQDLLSLTIRWFVEPKLRGNVAKFEAASIKAAEERQALIEASGLPEETLVSNTQFAQWIAEQGLEVPHKPSPANGWPTPALAKGDVEFQRLMRSNPSYDTVWKARIAAKSNININRPQKLANVCKVTPNNALPMALKWYGAHTGRWSGTENNVQNLPRGSASRTGIEAPPGHVIVVADSSQIELRVNAWISKEAWVLDALAKDEDIYKTTVSKLTGTPYDEVTEDQRMLGKAVVLGCGYGLGHVKFHMMCESGPFGMAPIYMTEHEAKEVIQKFRSANPNITAFWKECEDYLSIIYRKQLSFLNDGIKPPVTTVGPLRLDRNAIILPNDMALFYTGLHHDGEGWRYGDNNYIYSGKCAENLVQALARIIVAEQILECERQGIWTVSSTHDEILAIAPESEADQTLQTMLTIMSTTPQWAKLDDYPELILNVKGGYNKVYCK